MFLTGPSIDNMPSPVGVPGPIAGILSGSPMKSLGVFPKTPRFSRWDAAMDGCCERSRQWDSVTLWESIRPEPQQTNSAMGSIEDTFRKTCRRMSGNENEILLFADMFWSTSNHRSPFVRALAGSLKLDGELWIEVPDLESTLNKGIWSNFYQLHCNYFSAVTLDHLAVRGAPVHRRHRRRCLRRLHPSPLCGRWRFSSWETSSADRSAISSCRIPEEDVPPIGGYADGSVGYGAAERTAVMMGFVPEFRSRLNRLFDGNPLMEGRYFAGTRLMIEGRTALAEQKPPGIVLFAISNLTEILSEWKQVLDGSIVVGVAGGQFPIKPLRDYQ